MSSEKKHQWNISLNISSFHNNNNNNNNSSNSPKSQQQLIGKNITFHGDSQYLYCSNDVSIIGYGRIYNETDLWIDILKMTIPLVKIHPLLVVIELYTKFGFEKMMEYLDGNFSFILLDMNIYGDESILYIVRDPLGLCPLYQWKILTSSSSKRVQFQDDNVNNNEPTIYVFSSLNYIDDTNPFIKEKEKENMIMESIPNGTYFILTHSFKVSANWKFKKTCTYYLLPYYTTYKNEKEKENENENEKENRKTQVENTINKTIQYILHYENVFFVNDYANITEMSNCVSKIGYLQFEEKKNDFLSISTFLKKNELKYNKKLECIQINIVDETILEFEKKYPNIIQKLKIELNNNDPFIIRANFVPLMIAKYIKEIEPNMKYVFMGEPFVYKWIFIDVFERRQELNSSCFQEKIKGWVNAFFIYNIDLIIPYLDRILLQKI
jgi:hypothetical protein